MLVNLEKIVNENNIKNDSIIKLALKLYQHGTSKSIISAAWICCRFATIISTKYSADISKILNENTISKIPMVRKDAAIV